MTQDHTAFPNITNAAVAMAACNGAINRYEPEENCLRRLDELLGAEGLLDDIWAHCVEYAR